jgi:hypothetical protein
MKNRCLNLTLVAGFAYVSGFAFAQTSDDCNKQLLAATEAVSLDALQKALRAFEDGNCIKKPTLAQVSKATVEGLAFMVYTQSKKRAELHKQLLTSAAPGAFAVRVGSGGKGTGGGATASQPPDLLLKNKFPDSMPGGSSKGHPRSPS